eukprot:m.119790 g.119790  ORF g.119790 m.119790 type:complete len:1478 (-) comp16482_c0_seq1:1908-6341(-)
MPHGSHRAMLPAVLLALLPVVLVANMAQAISCNNHTDCSALGQYCTTGLECKPCQACPGQDSDSPLDGACPTTCTQGRVFVCVFAASTCAFASNTRCQYLERGVCTRYVQGVGPKNAFVIVGQPVGNDTVIDVFSDELCTTPTASANIGQGQCIDSPLVTPMPNGFYEVADADCPACDTSQPPVSITCPKDQTTQVSGSKRQTAVSWSDIPMSFGPASMTLDVTVSRTSGSIFQLGPTTINAVASTDTFQRASCSFTVTVQGPPRFVEEPTGSALVVNQGDEVHLPCEVNGWPAVSVKWEARCRNCGPDGASGLDGSVLAANATLPSISLPVHDFAAPASMEGIYTCHASNALGSVSSRQTTVTVEAIQPACQSLPASNGWPQFQQGARRLGTVQSSDPRSPFVFSPETFPLPSGSGPVVSVAVSADADPGQVFLVALEQAVVALHQTESSMAVDWEVDLVDALGPVSGVVSSPLALDGSAVVFGTSAGFVVSLDGNGTLRWTLPVANMDTTTSPPLVLPAPPLSSWSVMVVETARGNLTFVNGSDGQVLRTYQTPSGQPLASPASVSVDGATVYAIDVDGNLHGAVVATAAEAFTPWRPGNVAASLAMQPPAVPLEDGTLLIALEQGVARVNPVSQEQLWLQPLGAKLAFAIALDPLLGVAYVIDKSPAVRALTLDGNDLWDFDASSSGGQPLAPPVVGLGGTVFVQFESGITALRPLGGRQWALNLPTSSPSASTLASLAVGGRGGSDLLLALPSVSLARVQTCVTLDAPTVTVLSPTEMRVTWTFPKLGQTGTVQGYQVRIGDAVVAETPAGSLTATVGSRAPGVTYTNIAVVVKTAVTPGVISPTTSATMQPVSAFASGKSVVQSAVQVRVPLMTEFTELQQERFRRALCAELPNTPTCFVSSVRSALPIVTLNFGAVVTAADATRVASSINIETLANTTRALADDFPAWGSAVAEGRTPPTVTSSSSSTSMLPIYAASGATLLIAIILIVVCLSRRDNGTIKDFGFDSVGAIEGMDSWALFQSSAPLGAMQGNGGKPGSAPLAAWGGSASPPTTVAAAPSENGSAVPQQPGALSFMPADTIPLPIDAVTPLDESSMSRQPSWAERGYLPNTAPKKPSPPLPRPNPDASLNRRHASKGAAISFENLEFIRHLDEGEFGEVYEAKWLRGAREMVVAVKTLKYGPEIDRKKYERAVQEFQRETRLMVRLDHPNVVKVHGICIDAEMPMLVVEYMKYGSLLNHVKAQPTTGQHVLINMAAQVCTGMEYLVEKDLVHRDLAARNVLVSDGPVAKVSDLGLARVVAGSTYYISLSEGAIPLRWTAPEALFLKKYSHASDVWSFGVMLWELMTRCQKLPYTDMKAAEVLQALEQQYRLPCPEGCPSMIYDVMLSCWHTDRAKRPSFTALVRELKEIEAALPRRPTKRRYQNVVLQGESDDQGHIAETVIPAVLDFSLPTTTDDPTYINHTVVGKHGSDA